MVNRAYLDSLYDAIHRVGQGAFGTTFFVDGDNGSDAKNGKSPSAAFATIQAAIDACTSGKGDVIIVADIAGNYEENLTIAKSKVTIMASFTTGNSQRVAVAPTSGIALDVQEGALGLIVKGMRFYGTGSPAVQLAADGPRFEGCDFSGDDIGVKFVSTDSENSNTGSGAHFERCLFRECGAQGILLGNAAGKSFHATNVNVWNCQFYGNTGADISDTGENGAATYWYQWDIYGCRFMTTAKALYLDMEGGDATASDLLISNCYFAHLNLTSGEVKLPDAAKAVFIGNYDGLGVSKYDLTPQ